MGQVASVEHFEWLCHYSHQPYRGTCPVRRCWANIGKRHPSGCIHRMLGGRHELTPPELAFVLAMDKESIQRQINDGKEAAEAFFYFYERLQEVRVDLVKPHCELCGDQRSHTVPVCHERAWVWKLAMQQPFAIALGDITPYELFNLLRRNPRRAGSFLWAVGFDPDEVKRLLPLYQLESEMSNVAAPTE